MEKILQSAICVICNDICISSHEKFQLALSNILFSHILVIQALHVFHKNESTLNIVLNWTATKMHLKLTKINLNHTGNHKIHFKWSFKSQLLEWSHKSLLLAQKLYYLHANRIRLKKILYEAWSCMRNKHSTMNHYTPVTSATPTTYYKYICF